MSNKLIDFLSANKDHLKFATLDKEMGLHAGATARVIRGSQYRKFTPEQEKIIRAYLIALKKSLSKIVD